MKYRTLGTTGYRVSEISLGAWQLGARWGEPFNEKNAEETIERALAAGITFIDTADVYSDGLSEKAVGRFVRAHRDKVAFATKCGRRLNPHVNAGYNERNIRGFIEDSLTNMGLDCLDLVQLHCPPTEVYYRPDVFDLLDQLKVEGKIAHYGVSVEKVEEALKAIEFPGVALVQIIFNMFRQRPAELFFKEAARRNVGVIVRVPLASGLLSGKFAPDTSFGKDDHRSFNRDGAAFDRGETFSGVDYATGLKAVEKLKGLFPADLPLAAAALKWILMFPEVSCVIPGASRPEQADSNAKVSDMQPLTQAQLDGVKRVYEETIKPLVHQLW
ncbi:MAG: aldo/keto reductase [Spirochaetales bacterium]|nr:aldo/keto reductase [Spirochaetales bacterium]